MVCSVLCPDTILARVTEKELKLTPTFPLHRFNKWKSLFTTGEIEGDIKGLGMEAWKSASISGTNAKFCSKNRLPYRSGGI